jgi:hypothetical protein
VATQKKGSMAPKLPMTSRVVELIRGLGVLRFIFALVHFEKNLLRVDCCGNALLLPRSRDEEAAALDLFVSANS